MKPIISDKIIYALAAICIALAAADFFRDRHGYFDIESQPLVYCAFGLLAYAAVIFVSRALRRLTIRPEDYYGREATDAEDERPVSTEARDV
ncbi:MAG: hypothetical protein WA943_01345 [Parvibaculum sp.]|uniref:hypothetical protein n=1 Tax=Parvibaculum sp. TaxID=2024848 RepID=UPI003C745F79